MLFSQRNGFKPVKNIIQVDSMNSELRIGLWNCFHNYLFIYILKYHHNSFKKWIMSLWDEYFKKPIDTINFDDSISIYNEIRVYFFSCNWYEVYDFLEFILILCESINLGGTNMEIMDDFINSCNKALERENSSFRFVKGYITKITSDEEIESIETIFEYDQDTVKIHIDHALKLLTDKNNPDYRNSIKESISAVEAICRKISGKRNATLGNALEEIGKKNIIHPALKNAFEKLYGYTSDAEGIRHALLEEPNLSYEDALYMLVICSAFINYLIEKASLDK
ncbi:hypothetical protein PQ744_10825 [Thermoanaerobacterium thermosaccharolyticum]|uniref:AbiJ-NTD4 domain-containing protein n=1 Tax=Thermoanaerobacterium thermosaccharolyticum TaxID=1517 RepID=UPI003D2E7811